MDVSFLSTDTNYDSDGLLMTPLGLTSYQRVQTDLLLNYGISSRLSLFGRIGWAYVGVESVSRSGKSFGLADQSIGMNYRLFTGSSGTDGSNAEFLGPLDFQLQMDFPAYSQQSLDEQQIPHLGDQSLDITAGAFLTAWLHRSSTSLFELVGGAGATLRTRGFSSSLPFTLGLRYSQLPSGFRANLSLLGAQSLGTDARGEDLTLLNSSQVSEGTGGSFITNAINPSALSIRATGGFETSAGLTFLGSATQTLFGRSAPNAFTFTLGLSKRFGPDTTKKSAVQLTPDEYGKSNQGFINYSLEAKIQRVSDRLNLVRIDKGSLDGVQVGQTFDIFAVRSDGSAGEPIARTRVSSVKSTEAALTIVEYFKEVWIEEGFIAKRPIP